MTPPTPPQPGPNPAHVPPAHRAKARSSALPWLLFIVAAAFSVWAASQLLKPSAPGDPLGTALVAFEKENRLTVFSAELAPVVSSDDARMFGLLKSRQVAVIPARVDYTLEMGAIGRDRMRWDAAARRIDVTLPPIQLSRPNLDEARARYLREGVWITGTAQEKLNRANTRMAEEQAARDASTPALISLARAAAKEAVSRNIAVPLRLAGISDVTVSIRFDDEPAAR